MKQGRNSTFLATCLVVRAVVKVLVSMRRLFNNFHQNIKFTMEEESNGELAFLDTLLK